MTNPSLVHAPEPVPFTSQDTSSGFKLMFWDKGYATVPHLGDHGNDKIPKEIVVQQLSLVQVNGQWHYLNPEGEFERRSDWYLLEESGDKRWAFKFLRISDPNDPENADIKNNTFASFVENIATDCQQDPILCDENGNVLDGYTRLFACIVLKLRPKYQIVGNLPNDDAKLSFIRSRKLARPNLTERQRMQIVKEEIKAHPEWTIRRIAERLAVASNTVRKFRRQMERDGEIELRKKLIDKNGKEHDYKPPDVKPKAPKTAEEKVREKAKSLFKQAKELLGDKLLDSENPVQSLDNMVRYLKDTRGVSNHQKQGESLKATLNELFPPIHDADLKKEEIGTSLNRIVGFFEGTEAVPSHHQDVLRNIRQFIDQLLPSEPATTTAVGTTATALWNAKTMPLTETKTGISIKLKPAYVPANVDVLEGVKPGPAMLGGKSFNYQGFNGFFVLPPKPQDATVEAPREDDLRMERGTVDPGSAVG